MDVHTLNGGSASFRVRPATSRSVAFTFEALDNFKNLFEQEDEFSIGFQDTLYIYELSKSVLPVNDIANCINESSALASVAPQRSFENAIEDALNLSEASAKTAYQPSLTAASQSAATSLTSNEYSPFLTAGRAANTAQSLNRSPQQQLVPRNTSVPARAQPPVKEVIDVNTFPAEAYPASITEIKGHFSHENANNDDAELVKSLLVQLSLLEKEKEALRMRVAERPGPLSVIRSCQQEKQKATSLQEKLNILQVQNADLERQNEVNFDLAQSCQIIADEDLDL